MDINLIISLIIIFGVLSLVFFNCSDSKSKERFDQLDLITNESDIPDILKESSSVNNVSLTSQIIDISTNKKTIYGNFNSILVPSSINEYMYIDESNIDYIKNKVINISKPVKINVSNIVTSNFPIKLFLYNSTKTPLIITLMFTDKNSTTYSEIQCVSNYMTNDINRLKLSIDTSNILKNSVTIRKNYLNRDGIPIFYCSNTSSMEYNRITRDIDDVIKAPTDTNTVFVSKTGTSQYVTINVNSAPGPAPRPTPAPV